MVDLFHFRTSSSDVVALDSTGDKATFAFPRPIQIARLAVISSTAVTFGSGLTIEFDKRPTAGSDTGRGAADVGTITVAAAADIAQGKGVYKALTTPVVILPGEEVVAQVTAAMTAGDGRISLEFDELPFQQRSPKAGEDYLVNMTASS